MKKLFTYLAVLTGSLVSINNAIAQNPVAIVCQGTLTDMEGEIIGNKALNAEIAILDAQGNILASHAEDVKTTPYGSFTIGLGTIPADAGKEGKYNILITLNNTGDEQWIEDGTFNLDYTLERVAGEKTDTWQMKRFEGLVLEASREDYLWQFTDLYPFAYLSSRFMLSFNSALTSADEIIMLSDELFYQLPEEAKEAAAEEAAPVPAQAPAKARSRGLKGGYAVGGYKDDDD